MLRRPPISTRTDTLFPYTTLFRSLLLAPLEFPGDIDCLSVQMIDEHDLLVFEPIEPATESIRASGQVVVALAIHAMSFGLQNIFLLDRQFIVMIHMPNCRTGAEPSKGSRCEKMLLHLCLPQHDLAAITATLRRLTRTTLWSTPYRQ